MLLDDDSCYRALRARDSRFDGRFFVAVSSTRIYCRPVCSARTPKRENCAFFPNIAMAEAAGYRACLRCHPKLARTAARDDAKNYRSIRAAPRSPVASNSSAFELGFRPPYDWNSLQAFLDARAISGVEQIDGASYRRTVRVAGKGRDHVGWIEVSPFDGKPGLRVVVSSSLMKVLPAVMKRAGRLMDVSSNPAEIADVLGPLGASNPGLRVPGAFDGFEIGVRAILGQQVTVAAARTIAGRFAAAFGSSIDSPFASLTTAFPSPQRIAALTVDDIARLGVLASRSRSILALARAIAEGAIDLDAGVDVAAEMEKLRALPGIGEWTAQYIAMRALNWPDAFPHTDLGVMKALNETNPRRVLEAGEAWRPWRSYAVVHLWQSLHQG
ncbi:MAG: AlkA N-terminal domain-containing protein [Candidatus Binataceae bacterium]